MTFGAVCVLVLLAVWFWTGWRSGKPARELEKKHLAEEAEEFAKWPGGRRPARDH